MVKECTFCKLISGDIPCEKLYEDEDFIVILDINPYVFGHTLVLPKEHVRYVWNIAKYSEFMELVRKMARILESAFDTKLVQGGIAGVDVAHAHFHLFPRTDKGKDGFPSEPITPKPSEKEMKEIFDKIKVAFDSY